MTEPYLWWRYKRVPIKQKQKHKKKPGEAGGDRDISIIDNLVLLFLHLRLCGRMCARLCVAWAVEVEEGMCISGDFWWRWMGTTEWVIHIKKWISDLKIDNDFIDERWRMTLVRSGMRRKHKGHHRHHLIKSGDFFLAFHFGTRAVAGPNQMWWEMNDNNCWANQLMGLMQYVVASTKPHTVCRQINSQHRTISIVRFSFNSYNFTTRFSPLPIASECNTIGNATGKKRKYEKKKKNP